MKTTSPSTLFGPPGTVEVENPDVERFPEFPDAPYQECVLRPGDVLLHPAPPLALRPLPGAQLLRQLLVVPDEGIEEKEKNTHTTKKNTKQID
ncbi:hypothetical protein CRUP_006084 [Coryphaenoides rupestris]|nr:hypothetical protein CRUP_006084 [Coryphaenoides rupestris]